MRKNKFKKYRHLGYNYPGVPSGWEPIVLDTLKRIDKVARPKWMPMCLAHLLEFLAHGRTSPQGYKWLPRPIRWVIGWFKPYGRVVSVRYWWAYRLHQRLIECSITDIKEKYAELRIYGYWNEEVDKIVEEATDKADRTCQFCGLEDEKNVKIIGTGWYYNTCRKCMYKNNIR